MSAFGGNGDGSSESRDGVVGSESRHDDIDDDDGDGCLGE